MTQLGFEPRTACSLHIHSTTKILGDAWITCFILAFLWSKWPETLLFMVRLSWNFGWLILGTFYDGFCWNVSCCLHCLARKNFQKAVTFLFMLYWAEIFCEWPFGHFTNEFWVFIPIQTPFIEQRCSKTHKPNIS